jgi:hypothetical protein
VFSGSTAQQQWLVQTLPAGTPGTFTTIASSTGQPSVSLAGGNIFLTWANVSNSPDFNITYATQILDTNGNVLQADTPASSFAAQRAPFLQVRNITDAGFLGGGELYSLDLSQPSSPTPVALKTVTGTVFKLPSDTEELFFNPVTPTIGVADSIQITGSPPGPALVYDLAKGIIVPISMPNSYLQFLGEAPWSN